MDKEELEELVQLLQQRQAEAAREWEGKLAMTHLQYRKQLREQQRQIEELQNELVEKNQETAGSGDTDTVS